MRLEALHVLVDLPLVDLRLVRVPLGPLLRQVGLGDVLAERRADDLVGFERVERRHVARVETQADDRVLCILPMFHINALFYSVASAVTAGATLIIGWIEGTRWNRKDPDESSPMHFYAVYETSDAKFVSVAPVGA